MFPRLGIDLVREEAFRRAERLAEHGLAPTTAVALCDLRAPAAVLTREQWAVACRIGAHASALDLAARRGAGPHRHARVPGQPHPGGPVRAGPRQRARAAGRAGPRGAASAAVAVGAGRGHGRLPRVPGAGPAGPAGGSADGRRPAPGAQRAEEAQLAPEPGYFGAAGRQRLTARRAVVDRGPRRGGVGPRAPGEAGQCSAMRSIIVRAWKFSMATFSSLVPRTATMTGAACRVHREVAVAAAGDDLLELPALRAQARPDRHRVGGGDQGRDLGRLEAVHVVRDQQAVSGRGDAAAHAWHVLPDQPQLLGDRSVTAVRNASLPFPPETARMNDIGQARGLPVGGRGRAPGHDQQPELDQPVHLDAWCRRRSGPVARRGRAASSRRRPGRAAPTAPAKPARTAGRATGRGRPACPG